MSEDSNLELKKSVVTSEELSTLKIASKVSIYYALVNNKYPVEAFIERLTPAEKKKIFKLFLMMIKNGSINNTEKFKRLKKGVHEVLWEFKPDKIVRLGCVKDDGDWLLLIGLKKKRGDWVKRDFERFENNHEIYLKEKKKRAEEKIKKVLRKRKV